TNASWFPTPPLQVAIDKSNNLTILLANNSTFPIVKITAGGAYSVYKPQQDIKPLSITVDQAGNIYEADYANSYVRKITPGGSISVYAGDGAAYTLVPPSTAMVND